MIMSYGAPLTTKKTRLTVMFPSRIGTESATTTQGSADPLATHMLGLVGFKVMFRVSAISFDITLGSAPSK